MPVREILSDLVAEEQALDQYLQKIAVRDWARMTPSGWTIQGTVSHLATSEEYALNALEEQGSRLAEAGDDREGSFNAAGIAKGAAMRPQDVIEWWRLSRAGVVEALSQRDKADLVPWFGGELTAEAFAASRMMETWAHGLDIHAAMEDEEVEDTQRLRHIAWLAWSLLPTVLSNAGVDHEPIRLEVIGPQYAKWVFGPEDSQQLVKGSAGEWCRVATGRLDVDATTNLKATGAVAEEALGLVRAWL